MRLDRDRRAIVKHKDLESQARAACGCVRRRAAPLWPRGSTSCSPCLRHPLTSGVPEFLGDERKQLLRSVVDEFTTALGPDAVPEVRGAEAGKKVGRLSAVYRLGSGVWKWSWAC